MWVDLFYALRELQIPHRAGLERTHHFRFCDGVAFANQVGLQGSHWQAYIGQLGGMYESRLEKSSNEQPQQQSEDGSDGEYISEDALRT